MTAATPSLLSTVVAQDTAVATLRRALRQGRVHHAYLFDGPDGVGKERAALGLAQALVCERRGGDAPADDACGGCSACRRVPLRGEERRPAHPDVSILERGLYDPAQIGRRTAESKEISIDQVRALVLARAAFRAHEGRAKVFIVRRAEEMSVAAANALLKTLEEPGEGTYFVLLSAQPGALLSTMRSRTQRVRFGLLPEATLAALLVERGVERERALALARLAGGSASHALALSDDDASRARDGFVAKVLAAADAPDGGPALELAQEVKDKKDALPEWLEALADALARDAAARAAGSDPRDPRADVAVMRYRLAVLAARHLEANASPALALEAMLLRMRQGGATTS